MSADLSPDERVRRVRAALAEVGVKPVAVVVLTDDPRVSVWSGVPKAALWRASAIAAPTEVLTCWPCYDVEGRVPGGCGHDPLTSEWPEVVRR